MRTKLQLWIVLFGMFLSFNTFAAIFIEPLLGYNLGTELEVSNGRDYQWGKGPGYGGKFAFVNEKSHGLAFGLDYLKSEVDISNIDKNIKTDEFGVFLGYKLPAFLKFYGEYIFSSSGDTEIEGKKKNLSGTGWKFGMGTTIIPFLDVNLDYRQISYDKIDFSGAMLSLSFPIYFFDK